MIAGRTHVTVKFQAHPDNLAGGLYGLTLVRGAPAVAAANETKVKLPSGRTLSLSGSWKASERMWPDAALIFPGDMRNGGVTVICAGELKPRVIYKEPWGARDGHTLGFVFSDDASTCFAWLDNTKQLTAINMKDGSMKSLLKLPTLMHGYERLRHVDPFPLARAHLLFQVGSNLLLLLQQESNEEVNFFWQRSRNRHGGYQLVPIPQEGVKHLDLKAIPWSPEGVGDWDLARSRQEIYLLVLKGDGTGNLIVRRLDGAPVDKLGQRVRTYSSRMALSPDERWLLMEHEADKDYPLNAQTSSTVVRRGPLASVNEVLAANRTSICLLGLVTDEAIEIAGDAYKGTWAPDSQSVTYLRDWELSRLKLSDLKEERIAWREPSCKGEAPYTEPPTWSPDGKHLVVCIGAENGSEIPMLLLDFPRHEFIVVPEDMRGAVWSPIPRPFLGR
jgi:hypothetical protein